MRPSGSTAGVFSWTMFDDSGRISPRASSRWSVATGVYQQATNRLQREEGKTMSPSGRYTGSMSSNGPSVSCRRPAPSVPIW